MKNCVRTEKIAKVIMHILNESFVDIFVMLEKTIVKLQKDFISLFFVWNILQYCHYDTKNFVPKKRY